MKAKGIIRSAGVFDVFEYRQNNAPLENCLSSLKSLNSVLVKKRDKYRAGVAKIGVKLESCIIRSLFNLPFHLDFKRKQRGWGGGGDGQMGHLMEGGKAIMSAPCSRD